MLYMRFKIGKIPIIAVSVILFITIFGYLTLQISKSPNFQFFGEIIARVDTNEKVVALTFDDAPTVNTDNVLKILADNNIVATFYMIGKNIEEQKTTAAHIVEQGHSLGNHSYSHPRFLFVPLSTVEDELEKTNTLIHSLGFREEITFRPPYGKKLLILPWYLSQNNIKTITWDIQPDTYYPEDADAMVKYTLDNVKPGSIIIMHTLCSSECEPARKALPIIISGLKDRGYKFVTINKLLEYRQ
jgi:peptidoglycan/xylan/chitin deacetylase (PgdA/CDA1 family)